MAIVKLALSVIKALEMFLNLTNLFYDHHAFLTARLTKLMLGWALVTYHPTGNQPAGIFFRLLLWLNLGQ